MSAPHTCLAQTKAFGRHSQPGAQSNFGFHALSKTGDEDPNGNGVDPSKSSLFDMSSN